MRKSVNILLSILLSVMIVWIGSGVLMTVCEHTGNISVAEKMRTRHCNDPDASHCMKMQLVKLSPTNTVQTAIHHLQPIQLSLLPQLATSCTLLPLPVLTKAPERILAYCWHSPPRQYLHLLTTLLI